MVFNQSKGIIYKFITMDAIDCTKCKEQFRMSCNCNYEHFKELPEEIQRTEDYCRGCGKLILKIDTSNNFEFFFNHMNYITTCSCVDYIFPDEYDTKARDDLALLEEAYNADISSMNTLQTVEVGINDHPAADEYDSAAETLDDHRSIFTYYAYSRDMIARHIRSVSLSMRLPLLRRGSKPNPLYYFYWLPFEHQLAVIELMKETKFTTKKEDIPPNQTIEREKSYALPRSTFYRHLLYTPIDCKLFLAKRNARFLTTLRQNDWKHFHNRFSMDLEVRRDNDATLYNRKIHQSESLLMTQRGLSLVTLRAFVAEFIVLRYSYMFVKSSI